MSPKLSVSILGSDQLNLRSEIDFFLRNGVDWIHLDIFDGKFVPTTFYNLNMIKNIRSSFPNAFLDCHLCIATPMSCVKELCSVNVNLISVHYEAFDTPDELIYCLDFIRSSGVKAGIVLNPETDGTAIDNFIDYIDHVLVMTVEPGYGGLKLDVTNLQKVVYIKEHYPHITVGVDGGVNLSSNTTCIDSGADILICGSALTNISKDLVPKVVQQLKTPVTKPHWSVCETKHTPDMQLSDEIIDSIKEPIVTVDEIEALRELLCKVEIGEKFILSLGDCSEDITKDPLTQMQGLSELYKYCETNLKKPGYVEPVYRACGQILKPRTKGTEIICDKECNTFWGMNVNSPNDRELKPEKIVDGHMYAKKSYNHLKQLSNTHFIAHEALYIPYEDAVTKDGYNMSAHMVWVGNKTRQLDHQQINYLRTIKNPVGIKLDNSIGSDELLELIKTLNVYNSKGKIILIPRMGCKNIDKELITSWITAIHKNNLHVVWMLDPMHGNTSTFTDGKKVRFIEDIKSEIIAMKSILCERGCVLGGVMFEATNDNVDECIFREGSSYYEDQIGERVFESLCDPRISRKNIWCCLSGCFTTYRDVCLILAKKGSKGLPGKNKLQFEGDNVPFYLQTYYNAIKSRVFNRVYISTNDPEIIAVCQSQGVDVIIREDSLGSNDRYVDSVYHAVEEICKDFIPSSITISMCVQPFKQDDIYKQLLTKLYSDYYIDSVFTVSDGPGNQDWVLKINNNGFVKPISYSGGGYNQGRVTNLVEIDNSVVSFKYKSYLERNSPLPWKYLGKRMVGIKQNFVNKNFNCDINYHDDFIWGEFIKTYEDWFVEYKKRQIENWESGLFSDLLDEMGYKNQVITGMLSNNGTKFFGQARTILLKDKESIADYKGENIDMGLSFIDTCRSGEILLVQGSQQYAYFGQLMTRLCTRKRLNGVVIGGLTRDSDYTRIASLPIYAHNYSPVDIKERGAVVDTDVQITINGVDISPGDYIYGDSDGIVVIPENVYNNGQFQDKLSKALCEEKEIKAFISSGKSVREILSRFKSF